jgi:hypothetical protein
VRWITGNPRALIFSVSGVINSFSSSCFDVLDVREEGSKIAGKSV